MQDDHRNKLILIEERHTEETQRLKIQHSSQLAQKEAELEREVQQFEIVKKQLVNEIELLSVELAQIRDHNKQMDCLNQDLLKLSKDKSFKINKMVGILQRKESGSIIQNLKQDKDFSEYFKNIKS